MCDETRIRAPSLVIAGLDPLLSGLIFGLPSGALGDGCVQGDAGRSRQDYPRPLAGEGGARRDSDGRERVRAARCAWRQRKRWFLQVLGAPTRAALTPARWRSPPSPASGRGGQLPAEI
ncbi:hypothetical protein MTBUT4_240060 [Magnetospirillum sp. UT-4]|nr:hypothetical protein MTBUT4_240060 [Magnetospirillum sp. UT-4]